MDLFLPSTHYMITTIYQLPKTQMNQANPLIKQIMVKTRKAQNGN